MTKPTIIDLDAPRPDVDWPTCDRYTIDNLKVWETIEALESMARGDNARLSNIEISTNEPDNVDLWNRPLRVTITLEIKPEREMSEDEYKANQVALEQNRKEWEQRTQERLQRKYSSGMRRKAERPPRVLQPGTTADALNWGREA